MEKFGTYLKLLLWNKGILAIDLAQEISMSPATLTKYFKQYSVPDRDTFGKILDYLRAFLNQEEEMRLLDLFIEEKSGFGMGLTGNAIMVYDPLDRLIFEELKQLKKSQKETLIKHLRESQCTHTAIIAKNKCPMGKISQQRKTGGAAMKLKAEFAAK